MSKGVEFRSWSENDRRVLPALFLRAIKTVDSRLNDGDWMDDLHSADEEYGHGGDIVVGVLSGEVIAMGGLKRLDEETAEMKRVAVEPELHNRGLGTALLEAIETRAKELGIVKLKLDTTDLHVAARAMYERHGYTLVRREERAHPSGQTYDTYFYEKELE